MATVIRFVGGDEVTVVPNADEVLDALGKTERFARFLVAGGLEIHVAADQVAYVSQVPDEPG